MDSVSIMLFNILLQVFWAALSNIALSFGGYIAPDGIQFWSLAFEAFRSVFKAALRLVVSQFVEFRDTVKRIFDRHQFMQINDPLLI